MTSAFSRRSASSASARSRPKSRMPSSSRLMTRTSGRSRKYSTKSGAPRSASLPVVTMYR
jgi:hypothetical protein